MSYLKLPGVLLLAGLALRAGSLESVLARIDREAGSFRQMTARLKKVDYTAVLNDTTVESGEIWLQRSGRELTMRTEIGQPEPRSVGFRESRAEIYYPKIDTVQIYDLGKQRTLVDEFLVLGFGSTSKEMLKSYAVDLGGEEVVAGEKTDRLVLVPKSKQALEQFPKIELWIPANAGHPVQQRFMQKGGDYYLVTYSDVKINPNLPAAVFLLKLPVGVKKEYPQK
jgi:outer membrane lipoprotein-sorting protein